MTTAPLIRFCLTAACAAALAACTTEKTSIPGIAGPSEFGQAVSITATPDSIVSNGIEQSRVVVTVRDAAGSPKPGVTVRLSSSSPSFGTFTPSIVYTNSSGEAEATYTPPTASVFSYGAPPVYLTVLATPIGSNYQTANPATAEIEVLTPPVPASAPGDPVASVAASATAAKVGQIITFDASQSQPGSNATIADYIWDFGDGAAHDEHGVDASHAYAAAGTYTMTLGIVDSMGRKRGTFKQIVITN